MSRRQTIPPGARQLLADIAHRLRAAPQAAAERATEAAKTTPMLQLAAFREGWLEGETKHAAMDIEAVLSVYAPAPKKVRA